jgi:hypothetical protein
LSRFEGRIAVRAFLTLLIGAFLLAGCSAKKPAGSPQASIATLSSPSLTASEDYERAVADYNNCVLDHTSNLNACDKQRAIMNSLGKASSRSSLAERYETTSRITQTNNPAEIAQRAHTTNTPQITSSLPVRTPPSPETAEAEPIDARSTPTPTPF